MLLWVQIYGTFFFLWLLGAVFARLDNFVTVAQMQSHGQGFDKGIPLIGHMGCLVLDALPFPALMATWVVMYGNQWKLWQIIGLTVIATLLSGGMHLTYIEGGKKFPEFVTYAGQLTNAGWTHVAYMGYGFAIVGLAYLCTTNPAPWLVWLTTSYLIVHVTIGVHVIHKLWTPAWFPYHGITDIGTLAPILGSAVILTGMSLWALR